MPLLPRWRFMNDDAKAMTRRLTVSAAVVILGLLLFRALLPWLVLGLIGWWIWRAMSR
jgi:fatty acid desaturase